VRFAIPLLLALTALGLIGCTGGEDEATAPVPVAQRFVTEEDAPDSKADPVETRQTTVDFDEFVATLSERAVDPDDEEITEAFPEASFKRAGMDTRFYGETHTPGQSTHVVSSFIELTSEDEATGALEWLEADVRKPCPGSCAVRTSTFDVDDLPGGRGVHSSATADDIERVGNPDQQPFEGYWVGFTNGGIAYTVDLFGRPGSVSEEQALEIANAYYDRLTAA
jgi:hypothetical protein